MGSGSEVSRREGPGLTLSAFGPQPVFSELCGLKETIISSAPNLEYRDNLPCLGRKELCPVSVTQACPQETSWELLLVVVFLKTGLLRTFQKGF